MPRTCCGVPLLASPASRNGTISVAATSAWPAVSESSGPVLPGALQRIAGALSPRASACFSISFSCSTISSGNAARSIGRRMRSVSVSAWPGCANAIADFAAAAARDTVAQINAAGGQAITLTGDVTRAEDVCAMIGDTLSAYGRVDCAFNNAGIAPYQVNASGQKTAEWSEESFDRMIAVNLKGVWLCMKEEIPHMQNQGGGAIVNTASIAGLIGLVTSSAYVAAKHGVIGLTKTAALEYADANIRVNAVCPGFIKTQMTADTMRRRGDAIISQIPFRRMGEPGEIAEMVVWLCSERASYVSGASYNVDGGWMAV